ncbi:MAG: hypothetical protein QM630_00805 [Microbacterium sp.]
MHDSGTDARRNQLIGRASVPGSCSCIARVVQRPFTLVGVNPALDAFADTALELKEAAEHSARTYGRELAEHRGADVA